MASQRIIKINEAIRKELSELVRSEIKDPRVKFAKVFISVLEESKKEDVLVGLNAAGGFLRKEIARRINLRNTPQLIFKLDETIAYGMKMSKMIDDVLKDSESNEL